MANVFDIAKYILDTKGPMTAMKLQKLVYYAQAWSLVWDDQALFEEEIQAWANGPVVPDLYAVHRGEYQLSDIQKGDISNLTKDETETIDIVLASYGDKNSQWLSDRTHSEYPWQYARQKSCVEDGERCSEVITLDSMIEYYSSL